MNLPSSTQPVSHYPHSYPYADEISLFDLWDILVQRRWWIVGVWALTLLAAVAYLLVTKPVFESRAVVQIGQVAGDLIVPPAALVLELRERHQIGEPGRELPYLQSAKKEGDDAVVLVAEAHTASAAQEFLLKAVQEIVGHQQQRYEAGERLQEAALAAAAAQIEDLNQQARRFSEMTDSVTIDEAVKALLILQRSTLQTDLTKLHQQRFELQSNLSPLKSYPSRLVREPTLAEKASAPKRGLILALALVLGGMLGGMAAFFVEFLNKAKNRPQANA